MDPGGDGFGDVDGAVIHLVDADPGEDGDGDDDDGDHDAGGEGEEDLVHAGGFVVFLDDEFDAVGDGLEEAPRPDAVGADAVLDPTGDFAFEEDEVGDG